MITIEENYKEFTPHPKIRNSVERIVSGIPPKRVAGLRTIILTNTKALNKKRRRQKIKSRGRKVSLSQCRGWYIEKWNNNPAYIELLIDNIFSSDFPNWLYFSNFFVDFTLSQTIFHEVGHHIHKTQSYEFKEKEYIAEKWKDHLTKNYFSKRYRYIIYPARLIFYMRNKFNSKT